MRTDTILAAGQWDTRRQVDRIVADYEGRHRRRVLMQSVGGRSILLDLEHARLLHDGDGLELPDGGVVRIEAASERLLAVRASDHLALMRLAWHLGNRHLPASIGLDRILIRDDHVIADMVRGLGGTVEPVQAPFDPETGAYSGGQAHGHDHGPSHDEAPHHHHHHHHHHHE